MVYRSKLEAIYGGLFEAAGIDFTFEPKLFQTNSGYYLPDFYIHRYDIFLEIKPKKPSVKEWAKLHSVSNQVGRPALFLCGRPELEVSSSNYSGETMNYIVKVFFGIVFPNSELKYYGNINELIDLVGVEAENLIHYVFAHRLQDVLEDLNRHHISDYLNAEVTELAPEYRYELHKESPPIKKFGHCLLDNEYCQPGLDKLQEFFCELGKLAYKTTKY